MMFMELSLEDMEIKLWKKIINNLFYNSLYILFYYVMIY